MNKIIIIIIIIIIIMEDGKNKKWTYKGNNGSERATRHNRPHREEKTTMVWPC